MPYYRTGARPYINNVSNAPGNAANTVTCPAGVDTVLHMAGDGENNFISRTIADGYCNFDSTYNVDRGAVITRRCTRDTEFFIRVTVVNTSSPSNAVVKCFIVFSDDGAGNPTGGTLISSSSKRFVQNEEGTVMLKFFGNNIKAIYPVIRSEVNRDYRLNGFEVTAYEALRPA